MNHIGIHMLNGFSASTRVEMKFDLQVKNPTNGNDICNKAFGTCSTRRHNEFKVFIYLQGSVNPVGMIHTHLNCKLQPLSNH